MQVLADRLSGWVEGWGDAGRVMKGKPPATTRAFGQQAPKAGSFGPKGRALPANSTGECVGEIGVRGLCW